MELQLGDKLKEMLGMLGENAEQLKKDLTWTPLPSGPEIWEEGRKGGEEIKEDMKNKKSLKEKVVEGVRTSIYGGDPEKAAQEVVNDPSISTPGWMDKEDAARHLIAIGGIAQRTNPTIAKGLAKAYEFISGSASEEDMKMDKHNNELALKLFNAKDFSEVRQRVEEMMKDAQYKDFSDKDKPVFLKMDSE